MMPKRLNSLRLQGYDYSQAGMYFVTVVIKNRKHLFGGIVNETMMLNEAGAIAQGVWKSLSKQYSITLDEFIVMPNHVHGIIILENQPPTNISLTNVGVGLALPQKPIASNGEPKTNSRPTRNESPADDAERVGLEYTSTQPSTALGSNDNKRPTPTKNQNLSDVIRFFKSLSAKRINILRKTPGHSVWQNGFHDRIIRNENELNAIRPYIQTNPLRWVLDKEL